jgi:glycosyltransferase 2 family protein
MNNPEIIKKSFQKWKIWTSIALGILVASFMLFRSLNENRFIQVEAGKGTHRWIDGNRNQVVDQSYAPDFQASIGGDYKIEHITDVLSQINWSTSTIVWLMVALLCMVGRDFFYMWRIRILTNDQLTWKKSFSVIMLWEFASALSPGVVGGAAVAMFILNREKIALGRSTAIVIITAMMDNLFYVMMIPITFLFINYVDLFPTHYSGSTAIQVVFWTGYAVIAAVAVLLFLAIFVWPQLSRKILKVLFSLPFINRWKESANKTGEDIVITSVELRKESIQNWIKVYLVTCGSWISRYLVINAILQAFLNLTLHDHLLILGKQFVLWLFMLVSPTPGASGIAEYAFGELLISFSGSALLLAGMAVIWRLISYFPYLFIGAWILPRFIGKNK